MEKVKVNLSFINKKGKNKNVTFFMDKQSYEMINSSSIAKETRQQYLVDEYHEYERERYYKRKFVSFDFELAELLNSNEKSIKAEEVFIQKIYNKDLYAAIKKLNTRQQEIIKMIYWEGKTQKEVSEIYGVSKQAINNSLKRIYKTLQKKLTKEK